MISFQRTISRAQFYHNATKKVPGFPRQVGRPKHCERRRHGPLTQVANVDSREHTTATMSAAAATCGVADPPAFGRGVVEVVTCVVGVGDSSPGPYPLPEPLSKSSSSEVSSPPQAPLPLPSMT